MSTHNRIGIVFSLKTGLKSKKRLKKIQQYLESKNVCFDLLRSEGSDSIERLTCMLCNNAYKTIVVVGGDGSVNDAINGIMNADFIHKDFAFGIIPSGSVNDFAHFWDIQLNDYKKSIDSIIQRKIRKIDLGVFRYYDENNNNICRFFLNCVNIGLGAKLIELSNSTKLMTGSQRASNIMTMIGQVYQRKSFDLTFTTDSETFHEKVMSVCIGNTTGYGQTPNAVPYNGMLDMSVITRPEWWQLFEGFWLLEKGKFLNYKNVHPYRITKVVFSDIGKAKVSLDGRILQYKINTPLTIGVLPDKIPLIIP